MASDPYASEPEPQPYARPEPRQAYRREQPVADPYASAPRLEDPYAAPGAGYERPAESYSAPAQNYSAPAQTVPQESAYADPAAGLDGPRGSSQRGGGEERYDEVVYAGVRGVAGDTNGGAVVAVARAPLGSFLEVTSLETGKTILVLVTGSVGAGADHPIDLSPAAARLLGGNGGSIPVRVRKVNASPADQAALRAGQPASERADTPPVLLAGLRRHLSGGAPADSYAPAPRTSSPVRSAAAPARSAAVPTRGGYYVQVGAFSNGANANTLARSLGGFVRPGGGLFRVQMGPFRSSGEAEAARANAAARGYGDARVFTQN